MDPESERDLARRRQELGVRARVTATERDSNGGTAWGKPRRIFVAGFVAAIATLTAGAAWGVMKRGGEVVVSTVKAEAALRREFPLVKATVAVHSTEIATLKARQSAPEDVLTEMRELTRLLREAREQRQKPKPQGR